MTAPFAGATAIAGIADSAMGTLFGNDSSQSQSSSSSAELNELFSQLVNTSSDSEMSKEEKQNVMETLLGQIDETMKTSTVSLAQEEQDLARQNLDLISSTLLETISADYSPEQATKLSEQARNNAINQVLRSQMGDVIEAGTKAGAYDSTVQSDVATDVAARAAEQGSAAEQDMQKTFASLSLQKTNTLTNAMSGLLGILKGSEVTSAQDRTQVTDQQSGSASTVSGTQTGSTDTSSSTETDRTQTSSTDSSVTSETEQDGLLDKIFG